MLRLASFLTRCALDVYYPAPPRSSRRFRRLACTAGRWQRLHADEDGKLTFATIFAVLALVVMIGFVGNSGHAVQQKIELQNAADSAAYSSALWMARGMNGVTATNHMLGELTALCVVHEALGGPELDAYGSTGWDAESKHPAVKTLNQSIKQFGREEISPVTNKSPYWGAVLNPIHPIDTRLVKTAVDNVAPENEKFFAGATIYDARLNLKRELLANLMAKAFANLGYFVPPMIGPFPVGIVTAAAATAVHVYASAQIVLIIKEIFIIKAIEKAAIFIAPIKIKIEEQGVPTLAKFSAYAATGKGGAGGGGGKSLVAKRVDAALQDLGQQHKARLAVFPTSETLQLPLVAEPKPQLSGKSDWGDEETPTVDPGLLSRLDKMQKDMNEQDRNATEDRSEVLDEIEQLNQQEQKLVEEKKKLEEDKKKIEEKQKKAKEDADKAKEDDPNSTPKPVDPKDKEELEKIEKRLKEIDAEIEKIKTKRSELIKKTRIQNVDPQTGQRSEIPAGGLKPLTEEQRKTNGELKGRAEIQWQIDQLQAQEQQIQSMLGNKDLSFTPDDRKRLETLLSHVQVMLADRRGELKYAVEDPKAQMVKALSAGGGNPTLTNLRKIQVDGSKLRHSQWVRATYPYVDAFRSGVLSLFEEQLPKSKAAKSFRRYCDHFSLVKSLQFRTGMGWQKASAPDLTWQKLSGREELAMYVMKNTYVGNESRKGHEPWIKDERMAERYFTVVGFAYRAPEGPLFSSTLFKNAHPRGQMAMAQAMLYNANEQQAAPQTPGNVQANVGWDTLNWEPPVRAFEHAGGESKTGAIWPWDLFTGSGAVKGDKARVKLNWQAKLIPLTKTRVDEARKETRLMRDVRQVLDRAKTNFNDVITH
jgi:hypothetical protein